MTVNRSPLKAIRAKCVACCCGSKAEVRLCTIKSCPLWPFRSGHRLPKEIIEQEGGDEKNASTLGKDEDRSDSGEEDAD